MSEKFGKAAAGSRMARAAALQARPQEPQAAIPRSGRASIPRCGRLVRPLHTTLIPEDIHMPTRPPSPDLMSGEEQLADTVLDQLLLSAAPAEHHAAQLLLSLDEPHREALGVVLEALAPHAQALVELGKQLLTSPAEPAQAVQPQTPAPPATRRMTAAEFNKLDFVDREGVLRRWEDPTHPSNIASAAEGSQRRQS